MVRNRTGLAPWSLAREAGIESATVDGRIEVPQYVQPTLNTGFVDEKGDWKGAKSSDKEFRAFQIDAGIANGGEILTPSANADGTWPLDMTGYSDIFLALKTTTGGNYAMSAVQGPQDINFANLNPVAPARNLQGLVRRDRVDVTDLFIDSAVDMQTDLWNIVYIGFALRNQKLLQFKITNNSGAEVAIETAFMRLV